MKLSKIFLVVATLAVSIPAFAETPVINHRQANQQNRINQGVASGQLTGRETAKLERGQQHVANMKANAKADGVVTRSERAQIRHAQNVQSNRIYNKKHN
jgi:uncharacterized membrane protein YebE (DUF533 family)